MKKFIRKIAVLNIILLLLFSITRCANNTSGKEVVAQSPVKSNNQLMALTPPIGLTAGILSEKM